MDQYGDGNNASSAGDVYVQVPTSIFRRNRNPRDMKRRQQIQAMLNEKENSNHGFRFKLTPSQDPDPTETRPLPKCCGTCLPESEAIVQEEMKHLGLLDCFRPPTLSPYNSLFCRTFPFYSYYCRTFTNLKMHALPAWADLEKDSHLLSAFPKEYSNNNASPAVIEAAKKDVLKVLYELQVSNVWKFIHSIFVRFSAWFCQKYLATHFESVLVHGGQLELLRDVYTKRLPVIYIPTNRSSFDTPLILWALAHHGFQTPLFLRDHHAAKSKLLKFFGGIGSSLKVHSDHLNSERTYSSATVVYLQHLLRQGNSLMFNVESGKTRSGRPDATIYGAELIKIIYDCYESEKIEDVYFVPVSVSYEVLPEAEEITKDPGCVKSKPPSGLLSWIRTVFCGTLIPKRAVNGKVKIDFAQPFCFRELKKSLEQNVKFLRLLDEQWQNERYSHTQNCSYLRWNSTESVNSVCSLFGELAPLYPAGNPQKDKEATLVDLVTLHLIYDAGKCASVMPTHLLAFLLMKKFRDGVLLDELKEEMQRLVDTIYKKYKRDFGFFFLDCDMESIIMRAVEMLNEDVVCQWVEEKKTYHFAPSQDIISLRKLEYYANYILPDFIMEAVIATAIFAIRGLALCTLRKFDTEIIITDADLMFHCRQVHGVLTGAFLLHPPCWVTDTAIRKTISQMVDHGVLSLVMSDPRRYNWEDDMSDYEYCPIEAADTHKEIVDQEFIFTPEAVKVMTAKFNHLSFHRSLLMPYFEIFAFLTSCLEVLLDKEEKRMNMSELRAYLLSKLVDASRAELNYCRELCTLSTVKHFLAACEDHGYLDFGMVIQPDSVERMYYLLKGKKDLVQLKKNLMFYITK